MKLIKLLISCIVLVLTILILSIRIGALPPQGRFLNPVTGFWRNADARHIPAEKRLTERGISGEVIVKYDSNLVPHIFADNDHDLYFAQGYVTASARLWQMDWQVRVADGRLSEILNGAEGHDIFYRRIGVKYAAEKAIDIAMSDPATKTMLQAYSDGVNAYIKGLTPAEYPLEFKLFDYKPEEWRPINSLLILKMLGESLTGGEPEFAMTNALLRFGQDTVDELYRSTPQESPVFPADTHWDFHPDSGTSRLHKGVAFNRNTILAGHDQYVMGSNNWAVDGRRSKSGYPLVANDPHLGISLPSVWYQLQMASPELNVAGVSVPGIPCIIIGYNKNIAWGQTNSAIDVVDWYHITFKDSLDQEYWHEEKWNKVDRRIEVFKLHNGASIYDTILYTKLGPVVYDGHSHPIGYIQKGLSGSEGFAMHWTLYEPSNDLKAFYLLNRAGDYGEYRKALDLLNCPAQNFVFADNSRDIAMTVAGKIPIRRDNNSEYVLDGSRDENNWAGWIPDDQKPAARNPAAGFVSSANQSLTDSAYPYLLPGNYGDPSRAIRINERLNAMNGATVDSMRVLQNDAYSEIAKNVLPALLKRLDKKNEESAHAEVSELSHWDFNFHGTSEAASIFQEWWNQLYTQIWEDDIAHAPYRIPWPDDAKTVNIILRDTTSHWINNAETGKKETMTSLVNVSFQKCIETLRTKYGPLGTTWQWGNVRSSVIHHLAGIDAFSSMVTNGDGAPNTINALSNNFGPSWRMVVELGPVVKGYGVLPGGESGNPGSYFYDNSIRAWQEGKLNDMLFLNDKNDNSTGILETLDIKN